MSNTILCKKVTQLADYVIANRLKIGTAESCTGGGLSYTLTSIAGSSQWFERGLVTYSNEAKMSLLHVKKNTLVQFGAVSQQTAHEMVEGLLKLYPIDIGIAITGIAGPDGGSEDKPVGTVWIAWKRGTSETQSQCYQFSGDREAVRHSSIEAAINQLLLLCGIMTIQR